MHEARIQVEVEAGQLQFVESGQSKEEYTHSFSEEDIQFEKLARKYSKIRAAHRKKKEAELNDNYHQKKKIIEELRVLTIDESNLQFP